MLVHCIIAPHGLKTPVYGNATVTQDVLRSFVTAKWSIQAITSTFTSAAQQSIITEPLCRFLELLQHGGLLIVSTNLREKSKIC